MAHNGNTVTYRYTVHPSDQDHDGIAIGAITTGTTTFTDIEGNVADLTLPAQLPSTANVRVDAKAPALNGMVTVPSDGAYRAGEKLEFTLTFDENILISGSPSTLQISIGGTLRSATVFGSTANSISYHYMVQAGDRDSDGIAITSLALNGGTIRDAAGNDANLSLTGHLPSLANVKVDAVAPTLAGNIAVQGAGSYAEGSILSFTLTFDEPVTVTGDDSTLDLTIGSSLRQARYTSQTDDTITYNYTVQAGDTAPNGITIGSITLGASTVKDSAGNQANLSLTGYLPSTSAILVDTTAPAVSGAISAPVNATYIVGQHLDFTVSFDESVTVAGTDSTLALTIGSATREAALLSANGNAVTYRYTVQAGDLDTDGIAIGAITRRTSTFKDEAGNNAGLSLDGHLPDTSAVLIDAIVPTVLGPITVPADKIWTAGEQLSFTITFSENVTISGTNSTLELDIGGQARSAQYDSNTANSITYRYAVQNGDNDRDGIAVSVVALNGSTIVDSDGNPAELTLTGKLPALGGVRVDTAAPSLASATINGDTMVLSFADASELDGAHQPLAQEFTVTVAGAAVGVTGLTMNASTKSITLTLASPVSQGQAVTVAYADIMIANPNAIQDEAGNALERFSAFSVVNSTPTPPVIVPIAPPISTVIVDGVAVQTETIVRGDGTQAQLVMVPIVSPSRQDQVGNSNVADIALLTDSSGNSLLTVQVPSGTGLQSSGNGAPAPAGSSLTDLIREIGALTSAGSADQNQLTAAGTGFIGTLNPTTPLLVQTIVVSGNGGTAANPLGISSQPQGSAATQVALVIDTRAIPNGAHIELHNVDFAAIIGAVTVTGGSGNQHVWGDSASQTIILGEGDDVLHGGAGDDIIGSAGADDKLYGDAGDDLLFGGTGHDDLDGGSGRDTARFDSAVNAYSMRVDDGRLVMIDRVGSDGVDMLAAIEVLRFTGGQSMADDAVLARLYTGLLGRQANAAEVSYWQDLHRGGVALRDIAAALIDSPEAQSAFGQTSNSAFVTGLYQAVLGRSASSPESGYWNGVLDGGGDRATVALDLVNSGEKLASSFDLDFNHSDVAVMIRMYRALLGRMPDQDGLNYWMARHDDGLSLGTIADFLVLSPEANGGSGLRSDADFIDQLFASALGRAPASAEKALLLDQLEHGVFDRGQVLLNVAESQESIALIGSINTSIDLL